MRKNNLAVKGRIVICAFLSIFFITKVTAQQTSRMIKGSVISNVTRSPIVGATITVRGTQNAVTTNSDGNFSILSKTGETLVVTFVGYKPKEARITEGLSTINFQLSEDFSHLQDVVVVGYGTTKKSDLSSAVETISSKDLNQTLNTTLDDALQGKAANVYVSSPSGAPGAGSTVIIRGISTITGNYQPLYVIDGVQIRPSVTTGGQYNVATGEANALSGINPDDIANISILEGPAATSIYGAAGANGVVMITTKQGKAGDTRVNFSSSQTFQQRPKELPVMNLQQYAIYIGKLQKYGLVGQEPAELGDPAILGNGTDWQHALFNPTLMQKYTLSLSGGTDKTTFYLSGDYLSQNGVAVGSGFKRGSIRLNLTNQATKWLKFGTNLSAFGTNEKVNTFQARIVNLALSQNPTIPVKNPDGTYGGPATAAEAQYAVTNPIAIANLNNNYNTSFGLIGGLNMDVTPIKGLLWHTELNGNYTFNNNFQFNPFYTLGQYYQSQATSGSRASSNSYWLSLNTRVQYEFNIKLHKISAMVGHEATYSAYQGLSASGLNYSTTSVEELSVADPLSPPGTSYRGDGAGESYFARVNYTYNDKYIAQFVVRRDGSSNFGPNNRWGTFPAVSVAWKVSDEKFMRNITFINDLKLRAEYGVSGNAGSGGAIYSNLYASPTVWGTGFLPSNFPNPNLKWEQDQSKNVGLDLHMFNFRVEVIADAYLKQISNLILPATGPEYLGGYVSGGYGGQLTWPETNYGNMEDRGMGVTVNTVNISHKDFQWKTGFNFSIDKNKVLKVVSPINIQYYDQTNNRQAQFITEAGQPLSMITGYIAEGLFQNYKDITSHAIQTGSAAAASPMIVNPVSGSWVGDVKYKDVSGANGKPDGYIDQNDRTIIGNPWPKFTYNFTSTFSYKGFELNLFFTGDYGNQILNLTRYQYEFIPQGTNPYGNHFQGAANFAQPSTMNPADALTATLTNPGYNIPNAFVDANGNNRISQWNVESGSYLKLKNARISYRVPEKYLSKTNVLRGVVATFQVQNAFTITKYTGYDPEVGMYNYGGLNIAGMDEGRYPLSRSYTISVGLDF
ncbi:MAG TPA: SusC/RagA family TonB-linked outer membrane protein [Hanamia sp.]|nr:SusC/RagA family TonB-linked outer membrane protein [Hanamia sp.]